MVNATNAEIITAMQGINGLANEDLPVATALRICRVMRSLQGPMEDYGTVRAKIIAKGSPPDENGNVTLNEKLAKEMQDLMSAVVELDCDPLSVEDLEGIKIKPMTLFSMGPFLKS
jgi:hypothetical protein